MTPALIPMLLMTLLLIASDGADSGTARLLLSGGHRLDGIGETVIVGDADVTVGDDAVVTAPIYVIGGTVRIAGAVDGRVTQIAGTLIVDGDAAIDRLRLIGGNRRIAPTADIGHRTGVDVATRTRSPRGSVIPLAVVAGLLALIGARLRRTRAHNLDNIVGAVSRYPVIAATVGLLLTLTALSLLVFMAFTLVLIPVSLVGLTPGVAVAALGIIGWGHRLGRHLPLQRAPVATAVGVATVVVSLQLIGAVPIVGDIVVGFVVLSGLGAVAITYVGFTEFHPAPLPE